VKLNTREISDCPSLNFSAAYQNHMLYYKKSSSQHDQCALLVFSTRPSCITSNFSRNRANTRTYWTRTLL